MKLIFTISNDASTDKIMRYLSNEDVLRINADIDDLGQVHLDISDLDNSYFYVNNRKVELKEIDSMFIRRGNWKIDNQYDFLKQESKEVETFIDFMLVLKSSIGNLNKSPNKLIQLHLAKSVGLDIPNSKVVQQYKNDSSKDYITKCIGDFLFCDVGKIRTQYGGTTLVNKSFDAPLFPSLIQEKIEKQFEIRSFFVKQKFFSMAIFSQKNSTTSVDYRNYDRKKPNRLVPFKLPEIIKEKLLKLFKKLELNTGSADLIYSKDNKFVFLEVNPCGQFDWLALNCNYPIEKYIANILINDAK